MLMGIRSGMGSQATIDLYQKIVNQTPAREDQEHIHVIIDSYPQIPDRTQALLYDGEDPLPYLLDSLKRLELIGVTHVILPCNTAHAYIPQLQEQSVVTFINMQHETANYIKRHYPLVKTVGLLATTGTVKIGLYQDACSQVGLKVICPNQDDQETFVMRAIYGQKGIKAGYLDQNNKDLLYKAAVSLIQQGAELIIGGCTEIPLVINKDDLDVPFVDPTDIVAQHIVSIVR